MKTRTIPAVMNAIVAKVRTETIEECAKVADLAGDDALSDTERYYATLIAKNIRRLKVKR